MELHNRMLLISNSTVYGRAYLDHVESEIKSFLGSARRVLFFPFALHDWDAYTATVRKRFGGMGYSVESAHEAAVPQKAVEGTDAIFIGGATPFDF
jgi:dipeptidase E